MPYDRTHVLSVAYNVMLPGSFAQPFAKAVINGWQVSGISRFQSGGPLRNRLQFSGSMANGEQISPITVNGTPDTPARPHLVCDPRENLGENQYANAACFSAPSPGDNGVYALPYMKKPAYQNHDISLFKNWAFTERKRLQLRFSMYNFLNHPIPSFAGGGPGRSMVFENGRPTQKSLARFGRTTFKRGRRFMQFALKFYF